MKLLLFVSVLATLLFSCTKEFQSTSKSESEDYNKPGGVSVATTAATLPTTATKPNHIVFVWFENKGYSQIIGSANAPYINSLKTKGTLFTNAHGLTHPSYPNYIAFHFGSTLGITTDNCIDSKISTKPTLFRAIRGVGLKYRWYSEGLPAAGSEICSTGYYREKHNPTTISSNDSAYINQPLTALNLTDTSQFKNWPSVVQVTPNMINDMHDGTIQAGDTWLKTNFDKYVQWAAINNSILVVYFDEDNKLEGNKIPVVMVGQHIQSNIQIGTLYDHYSFSKLICNLYGASTTWSTSINSAVTPTGFWK